MYISRNKTYNGKQTEAKLKISHKQHGINVHEMKAWDVVPREELHM